MPEFSVKTADNRIVKIDVVRGAPCGATWDVAKRLVGQTAREAAKRMGLDVQFFCTADPSGWDPISGKSPIHIAGELHDAALKKALKKE